LLSKYENFTLEWREKFEESLSFGEARGEGAWLCINAYSK
jgi:hypothetical protein